MINWKCAKIHGYDWTTKTDYELPKNRTIFLRYAARHEVSLNERTNQEQQQQ